LLAVHIIHAYIDLGLVWGCSTSLSAAAKIGSKVLIKDGAFAKLVLLLRFLLEFPMILLRDYIWAHNDQNIFKRQLTGEWYTTEALFRKQHNLIMTGLSWY